jgi:uncharacterized Tic20 family protein
MLLLVDGYSVCVWKSMKLLQEVKALLLPVSVVVLGSWLIWKGLKAEKKLDKDLADFKLLLEVVRLCK